MSGSPGGGLPTCEPDTGANGGPDGTQLHLVSQGVTFDANCLNAPARTPFTILFDNLDPGTQKNVADLDPMVGCFADAVTAPETAASCPHTGPEPVFTGEIIDGTGNQVEIVYQIGPLDAGTYYFQDDLHPTRVTAC